MTTHFLSKITGHRYKVVTDTGVSNSQRYKMIGNGWTVDVIAHIFSFISANKC